MARAHLDFVHHGEQFARDVLEGAGTGQSGIGQMCSLGLNRLRRLASFAPFTRIVPAAISARASMRRWRASASDTSG